MPPPVPIQQTLLVARQTVKTPLWTKPSLTEKRWMGFSPLPLGSGLYRYSPVPLAWPPNQILPSEAPTGLSAAVLSPASLVTLTKSFPSNRTRPVRVPSQSSLVLVWVIFIIRPALNSDLGTKV